MDTPCPSGGTDSKSPAYPSTGTDCFLSPRSIPLNLDCFLSPRSIPLNLDLVLRGSLQFRLPLPGGAPAVCGCSSGRAPHPVSQTPWHAHPTLFTGAMAAASSTPGRRISMDIPHPSLFSSLKKRLTQRKQKGWRTQANLVEQAAPSLLRQIKHCFLQDNTLQPSTS